MPNILHLLSSSTPIQPAKIHLSLAASKNTLPPHSPEEASNPQWTRHALHLQATPKNGRKNSSSPLYRSLLTHSTLHRSHALYYRPFFRFDWQRLFFWYSKSASEYYDPCQEFADRSIRCMRRNAGDREMCGDYFQWVTLKTMLSALVFDIVPVHIRFMLECTIHSSLASFLDAWCRAIVLYSFVSLLCLVHITDTDAAMSIYRAYRDCKKQWVCAEFSSI